MSKSSLLCLGYGYSAAALAAIIGDDVSVTGTTRSKPGDETFNRIDWADRPPSTRQSMRRPTF